MIQLKKTKSKKKITIDLADEINIENAIDFKETLLDVFKSYQDITIDLKKVKDMHVAILQIILAAQKEAEKTNKKFHLEGHLNKDFIKVLHGTGFSYYAGEDLQTENNSFWITGGK